MAENVNPYLEINPDSLSPEKQVQYWVHKYGHHHVSNDPDISLHDFLALPNKHPVVMHSVQSYQEWFREDLSTLTQRHHKRVARLNGGIGPATQELLNPHLHQRCGCQDIQHPHHAIAEANWPKDCRRKLTYGRTFPKLPGLTQEKTDLVWWGICNNWTAASEDVELFPVLDISVDPLTLDLYANLKALLGSTLAWQTLALSRCDVSLVGSYDSTTTWNMILAVTTGTHEIGHGLGHNHVNDPQALMFPSIRQPAMSRRGFPNQTDLNQHKRLGYSIPSNPVAPKNGDLWLPRNGQPKPPAPTPEPPAPTPEPPTPQTPENPGMLERLLELLLKRLLDSNVLDKLVSKLVDYLLENLLGGLSEEDAVKDAVQRAVAEVKGPSASKKKCPKCDC